MKKTFLIIAIFIIIILHWYSSRTEKMIPKAISKENLKATEQKKQSPKKVVIIKRISKLE